MAAPSTSDAFLELVRKSGLIEQDRLDKYLGSQGALEALPSEPKELATLLIRDGLLTYFQAQQLLKGKYRGFTFNKYQILERLGSGRNSSVFLCSHVSMHRKVALKILPLAKAEDPATLARFYREARAAGTLDHPNIVRTFDNGQEGDVHFLVMEYVDGYSLQGLVEGQGPMDITRAAAYIHQAAIGLQHIHQAGLVHRDIKPGNILLDRRGIVKILDLGLARFYHDHKDMLTQQSSTILGTADYLSPEQALDSHDVDTRTDIYSLGATFYFLLAGHPPFEVKAVTQKVLSHLTKEPTPLRKLRWEIPEALAAIIEKMMAKDRAQRYQTAAAVVVALAPWTQTYIAPPSAQELPQLSPAAQTAGSAETDPVQAAAMESAASAPRRHKEPRTYIPHAGFDRQRARAGAPRALAQSGRVVGRSASKPVTPFRIEQPPSSHTARIAAPPEKPLPDNGYRAPGERQAPDTVCSISGIDTRPDWLEDYRRRAGSGQPVPAKPPLWKREQVRKLASACLLAAALGSALGALFSKSTARPNPQEQFPGDIRSSVPSLKKDFRERSSEAGLLAPEPISPR